MLQDVRRSVRDAAERAPERARRHQSPACLGAPQKSPGHDGPGDDAYGGDEGIRTLGLCLAKAALSQLSYIPKKTCKGEYRHSSAPCQARVKAMSPPAAAK